MSGRCYWIVEWACETQPERVTRLFAALELDRKGLEPVKAAVAKKDFPAACRALLEAYAQSNSISWLRKELPAPGAGKHDQAEKLLNDTFAFHDFEAKVPRRADGGLDWLDRGPNDEIAWTTGLNRHSFLKQLLDAHLKTGNAAYARRLRRRSTCGPWATRMRPGTVGNSGKAWPWR